MAHLNLISVSALLPGRFMNGTKKLQENSLSSQHNRSAPRLHSQHIQNVAEGSSFSSENPNHLKFKGCFFSLDIFSVLRLKRIQIITSEDL